MFNEQPQVSVQTLTEGPQDSAHLHTTASLMCDQGRYIDAHQLVPQLQASGTVENQLIAARILWHVGARRRADSLVLSNWRKHRADAGAQLDMIRTVGNRHGPYRAWRLLQTHDLSAATDVRTRAEWHSLRGMTLGTLRDFDRAAAAHQEAAALEPENAWVWVERAYVCSMQDHYDEAIELAEKGLQIKPGYRSAYQALSHFYTLVGRDQDALDLLSNATRRAQSVSLGISLYELQSEAGLYGDAQSTLDYCERCLVSPDQEMLDWIAARRADMALRLGDFTVARHQAALAGGPFYERLAQRLQDALPSSHRVELTVGFVRQHFMTCAPATLAALSNYWGQQASHLDIAEAICYDGTPNHSERRWAEDQGFFTREFTVDWDTTRKLIDAGIPFTLTTVATNSAHLQAVIGYDELRETLLIRDPFKRTYGEFDAQAFFDSHRSSGPRGMLLIPECEAHRADGINLPDAPLWDLYHQAMLALSMHDRQTAVEATRSLSSTAPDHRLSITAARSMAYYDSNEPSGLVEVERLLQLYPNDANLALQKAGILRVLGSRTECEDWWNAIQESIGFDPIVAVRYAQFLAEDARQQRKVFNWLERTLSVCPTDGNAWFALAGLDWQRGRRETGLDFYRIAACLQDTNDYFADTYVRACRAQRQEAEGLSFLRRRVEAHRKKSSAPALALFSQLELIERTEEGFDVLRQALLDRPHDPELLLFAADVHLRYGRFEAARQYLDQAEPVAKRAAWLRLVARLHREQGQTDRALDCAQQACELEPLHVDGHRLVASLLAQTLGRRAAVQALQQVASRHPHHFELQRLLLNWLPDESIEDAIAQLRHMLSISPHDPWIRREIAVKLGTLRRFEEASEQALAALQAAPKVSSSHSTLAYIRLREGRAPEARKHLRDALELSVDNDYAVNTLIEIESTLDGKRQALNFVRDQLIRQTTTGDGLLAFQESARQILEPDELLSFLQYAMGQREDLWQCWIATTAQLTRMGQHSQALDLLVRAIERFPLLPRVYVEQAHTLLVSGQRDAARGSLLKALEINATWSVPVRMYVDSVLDEGQDLQRAQPILERALQRTPDNADLRGLLGWLFWRLGQPTAALSELRAAVAQSPELKWLWDALDRVGKESGDASVASQAAEDAVRQRPGDVWAWLRAAEFAADPARALEAVDHGLKLEPRNQALFEFRLRLLMGSNQFDAVAAALETAPWGRQLPAAIAVFHARLARARGNLDAAFEQLQSLLALDGSNFQLWRELADLSDHHQRNEDYRQAAEHMVRLAPMAAISHGYLGHALARLGQTAQAKASLQRAFELDPSYVFAGLQLADMALNAGIDKEAQKLLDAIEHIDQSPVIALRRLRLAILRRDQHQALTKASEIIAAPKVHPDLVNAAIKEVEATGWAPALVKDIGQLITQGRCTTEAAQLWISHQGKGWMPNAFYRDIRRQLENDPGHSLKRAFLTRLGEGKDRYMLTRFVTHYKHLLRADPESWALAGYAYVNQDQHADAIKWMADWRARIDAPDWALDNLALALRKRKQHDAAREVTQRSLALNPGNLEARTWLALDAARAGKLDELSAVLSSVNTSTMRTYYRVLIDAMQSYLDAASANDSRRALAMFSRLAATHPEAVLRDLLRTLKVRLVRDHTPPHLKPWRALQFLLGWQ